MSETPEKNTVATAEDLRELPDWTVVLSAPQPLPEGIGGGGTAYVVAQKILGNWYLIGMPYPTDIDLFKQEFFPATVIYRL